LLFANEKKTESNKNAGVKKREDLIRNLKHKYEKDFNENGIDED